MQRLVKPISRPLFHLELTTCHRIAPPSGADSRTGTRNSPAKANKHVDLPGNHGYYTGRHGFLHIYAMFLPHVTQFALYGLGLCLFLAPRTLGVTSHGDSFLSGYAPRIINEHTLLLSSCHRCPSYTCLGQAKDYALKSLKLASYGMRTLSLKPQQH